MEKEEAIKQFNDLINCLEKANYKGTYTLKESFDLFNAITAVAKFIESLPNKSNKHPDD